MSKFEELAAGRQYYYTDNNRDINHVLVEISMVIRHIVVVKEVGGYKRTWTPADSEIKIGVVQLEAVH